MVFFRKSSLLLGNIDQILTIPPKHHFYPVEELRSREGLGHVVTRPQFVAFEHIRIFVLRRQDNYGNLIRLRVRLDLPEDLPSVLSWHEDIANEKVEILFSQLFDGLLSIRRLL